MALPHDSHSFLLLCFFIILASGATKSTNAKNFTLVNQCNETIWPAIITDGGNFRGEGFTLKSGQTAFYNASNGWSGRIWGRTGCSFDKNGNGTCQTGTCGTSMNCTSAGSLPIVVKPGDGKGNCSTSGCDGDLRQNCSSDLQVKNNGKVVGCRSACDAFNTDEYCCRGDYKDPVTCLPTNYSKSFKQACPAASSYAYDDRVSVITCSRSEVCLQKYTYIKWLQSNLSKLEFDADITIGFHFTIFDLANSAHLFQFVSF